MHFVYVLFSKKDKMLYVGITNNLKIRIRQHLLGEVESTKNRRPLILIYYEAGREKSDALRRERYLKGGMGRGSLKKHLQDDLRKIGYKYL